jgi:hypothetical protein
MAKKRKSPPPPQPIDIGQLTSQISSQAQQDFQNQLNANLAAFPQIEGLQLGTIDKVASNLDNQYTAQANAALGSATADVASLRRVGDRIGSVGSRAEGIASDAQEFATGPTRLDRQIAALGETAMAQRADQVAGSRVANVGSIRASAAERGLMREAAGQGLLGQLENQAATEMALGRNLSPEQEREAAQAARAGMSARGLGVGNAALAAEVLNRDRFASQREAERRAFASGVLNQATGVRQTANQAFLGRMDSNLGRAQQSALAEAQFRQQAALANQDANQRQVEMNRAFLQSANQSGINSQISRGSYAMGALGQTANIYGQQAGIYQNAAGLGLNIANQSIANDPYMRAFAPGTAIGSGVLGQLNQTIGNAWNNASQLAGNVASFNTNMAASNYNSFQNNQAALQGARMQAGATAGASQNAMMGSGMAAGGMVLGMTALAI